MRIVCHVCGEETKRYGEKNSHFIYRCRSCELLFVFPLPASTSEIYGKDYFEGAGGGFGYVDYDEDKEPMVPAFKKYLALIQEALSGKGRLLDVGAATGFFVRLARDAGFEATGVELSDHAASLGRSRGLDIKTGTLKDVHGTFDCVTMLDVIEHVADPRADIDRAHALLSPGGILVINTPDAGSFVARAMGLKWHLVVPPEHLYYFSRSNIRQLLESEGFEVVLNTTIGKAFTLPYVLKTLHKWTKLAIFDRLASLVARSSLARFSIPLNLRDNMFILARKVGA
ncbi:hypothetical protein A3A39_03025 [Candidatus Kaiserbacteria bacterium RIFCSPLOWO2_01_FULL_54_13]|uniref:Methyltransferase type 11 domain-containing protein n=1 Tax=Candidatus Kaiserbacteria bacterium RIFCSPLOWO2_01_FULL_54_13 TaxID=1798512 RepID=A0A1F6F2D8_9BACT|nr:MAG: hypothetical protein A3A39_03025 [Candidatus Kaiserbacteria bacterium RIFCSPLOWO2_01_FULL_54_13]